MWEVLEDKRKQEYKRMILAFASLSEMFAQKAETDGEIVGLTPIINSKYQETVFQRTFNAVAEDIGNTSYDASIDFCDANGNKIKFLVGIKTFGLGAGAQKIAQFKAKHDDWSELINQMKENAKSADGTIKTKDEIDVVNNELYLELAKRIAGLRNARIKSSEANLQGFSIDDNDNVQAIYHVLMSSKKGEAPAIYVGETDYTKIDIENISVIGCTSSKNPTNFGFKDGNHTYRYTSADSQLLMEFKNQEIIKERWSVVYAEDPYSFFSKLADTIYSEDDSTSIGTVPVIVESVPKVKESYSWMITNENGEVEPYSGYNNFYGVGSKIAVADRSRVVDKLINDFSNVIDEKILRETTSKIKVFLADDRRTRVARDEKALLRKEIVALAEEASNNDFLSRVIKLIFRPKNEMYIPIQNSRKLHSKNPDFFGPNIGTFREGTNKLALNNPSDREFNLVFEPSKDCIRAYITQDNGKGIESVEKQSYLGEWILRRIFQLPEFEPLTARRLNEIGINGVRLYKTNLDDDVHLQFIWIDEENLPSDYINFSD